MASRALTQTLADDPLGGTVRRTVLPNGLRILTESIPAMRSVSFGVWVGIGSRDETPALSGVSHFLEHLLFKGTKRRSALDISAQIEAVGGETNAFTAKEYTCYYARVLDADLPLAIDVVCDLVTESMLAEADVETERGVILEEIAMHDDEPGDEVHDVFTEAIYGHHPLGRQISGTVASISALSRKQIDGFYHRRYLPSTMVVAAAGNLDHAKVVREVRAAFDRAGLSDTAEPMARRSRTTRVPSRSGQIVVRSKDTEQAHLVLGCLGYPRQHDNRWAVGALNNVLGGGMSSRLFQQIREQRGLAYSVYSFTSQYSDTGLFGVYAGCAPGKVEEVLDITRDELARVAADGVTDAEVERGKGMLKGAVVLGLEDTGSRMSRLGKGELLYDELLSVDEILRRVDEVTPEMVRQAAADLLARPMSLAVIGEFDDQDFVGALD
ncbi:pitrilysin family protein [Dactylosporangium fulvum]|uniref:Insulinase family protein n=1 Tax=Dactylosporangium fulvum TaxID=53359 RepID=A0ABY5W671_9ACTN|nr:pitrilysin family protein [Dactylosporangium fulvum]UWP84193.1 insulinase family protein [Dactylosporangium fulvum]